MSMSLKILQSAIYAKLSVVIRVQPEAQTKESARRDGGAAAWLLYGHMFLLCVLGHMFLLCGAGPYVSIVRVYVCVYVCVYVYMCVCVCVYVCVCVRPYVFVGLPHHSEGTCWCYRSSSN